MLPAALPVLLVAQAPPGEEIDFGTTTARRVKLLRHENSGVRRRTTESLAHAVDQPERPRAAAHSQLSQETRWRITSAPTWHR